MRVLKAAATFLVFFGGSLLAQRADTVVRLTNRPVHAGIATLQREISIGVADGDENYMLGSIADIAVGPSGSIYVWDGTVPAIRMYDAAGKYLKTIGRRGSGPGEYQAGAAIAVAKTGNLLMWDPGNARINVYTATGDVVATWPTLSGGSGSAMGHGLLMIDTAGFTHILTFARAPGATTHHAAWIRFRPDGSLKDTLFAPIDETNLLKAASPGGQRVSNRLVPFAPSLRAKVSPFGYMVTGYNDRIALDLHEPGKPVVSIRRNVALQPVSASERDSARADIIASMREVVSHWSWNGPDIPRTKPAYTGLTIASDGRLWVQLAEGPREKADSMALGRGEMMMTQGRAGTARPAFRWSCPSMGWLLFDVYEPAGRYLGQVRVPAGVDPLVMRGDLVWAATCSDDDVPIVVRYRIAWR
jgi:hypothetical protein